MNFTSFSEINEASKRYLFIAKNLNNMFPTPEE